MQTVTEEQREALNGTATRFVRVDVLEPDGTIAASTDPGVAGIQLYRHGGSVTVDGSADIERTLRISFADPDGGLVPNEPGDLIHPLSGRMIRVRAGVRVESKPTPTAPVVTTDHLWDLGLFDLYGAETSRDQDTVLIDVEADDRSARVKANAWPQPRFAGRQRVPVRLEWILEQADPRAPYRFAPSEVITPRKWFGLDGRNDRLADMQATARRAGHRVYVDASGTWVSATVRDPEESDPVWLFSSSQVHNLTAVSRGINRRDTINVMVLDVQSPENPDTGEQRDFRVYSKVDAPKSPLWIGGPLGRITAREKATSPMKKADAQAACDALLKERRRLTEVVRFTSLVNYALEAFDVVYVEDDVTGTIDAHSLERFTIDLDSATADSETQARRVRP